MKNEILVRDLLEMSDPDRVCELIQKQLGISDADPKAVRQYFGNFLNHLLTLTPQASQEYLFVVPLSDRSQAFTTSVTIHQFLLYLSVDIDPFLESVDWYANRLKLMPWEQALGMEMIWFPYNTVVPSETIDLVVADLIAHLSYFGATSEVRNESIATMKRVATIDEYDKYVPMDIPRVCPWFVRDTVVDIETVIKTLSATFAD